MKDQSNPLISPKYRSYKSLVAICINASLSAFFVGYSLVYMGSLSTEDFNKAIINDYGFNDLGWGQSLNKSVIQGAIPIGAIFGALMSSQVIRFFSRRNGFLFTNVPAFLSILLMVYIKNPFIFLTMRLIQGICTGIFSAIVPLYINEIVTPDLTNLGSLNQILIVFAQFFCFLLAFFLNIIFQNDEDKQRAASFTWKIIGQFPLITILIQSLLFLFVFPYQTPKYLYQKGLREQAANLINLIYHQEHIQDATARFKYNSASTYSQNQEETVVKLQMIGVQNSNKQYENSYIAIFFAIHIALLQQLSGVNAIAVYGKNTLQQALSNNVISVGLSSIGIFVASLLASILTIRIMNMKGRKYLIQVGTLICAICLGLVAFAFKFKGDKTFNESKVQSIIIIAGMVIYMTMFGLTLGPIVWLYIPEIVQPNIIPFSTMANLGGAAICIIVFPLIASSSNGKFVSFLFFFVWSVVSLVINQKIMVETRNKSRQKVFQEFKQKKLC